MSYKTEDVTQMLDRLKLPSATAGGPGDCCSLVRYTTVWPYEFISLKHLTCLDRGGEVDTVVLLPWPCIQMQYKQLDGWLHVSNWRWNQIAS
jgi:hypothetical protein